MPLTPKQAFKVGFLLKCAEQGMTMNETRMAVKTAIASVLAAREKQASPLGVVAAPFEYAGRKALDLGETGVKLLPTMAGWGLAGAVGLPIAAGAGAGYLAAKATGADGKSMVEDAKQDEIVGEYERLAEEARRRARIKRIQDETGRRIVALTPSAASPGA